MGVTNDATADCKSDEEYKLEAVRDEYHFPPQIRISNIFEISILHEYEYKYIRDIEFGPNTNMNIFVHAQYSNIRIFWYEYLSKSKRVG